MNYEIAYNIIRKAVEDKYFLQSFIDNPDCIIRKEGLADSDEISQMKYDLLNLLKDLDQTSIRRDMMLKQLETTLGTADKLKNGLKYTIDQIEDGFKSTMKMYQFTFYLGLFLIISSVVLTFYRYDTQMATIMGGLGVVDVIVFFIIKPPQNLQRSRADLAQLQLAYFNWFINEYYWNMYFINLGKNATSQHMTEISKSLLENTGKTMKLIETYCELSNNTKKTQQEENKRIAPSESTTS